MANPCFGDTRSTPHSAPTVTLDSALVPGSTSSLRSRTDASAVAQFSMELRELEAVHASYTLS